MWLGNVEVPRALVEAHANGSLVLFVGAGASVDPPSGLPAFEGLARLIVGESQLAADFGQGYPQDQRLGIIDDRYGIDVHARVAAHIARPDSVPNRLHHAIAALASAANRPRIVTTNYDRHLSLALEQIGREPREYLAPALPVGDDFDGIVYLHGAISQEPRRLVVTDSDFGRAYLSDAWAARFLERMFAAHPVLFIGYSHHDVIMTYLARGLSRSQRRYVMTDDPDADGWAQLQIYPVAYEVVDGSHEALQQVIGGWARRSRMGQLDHRQMVRAIVQDQEPSEIPEEVSYLEDTLADSRRVQFFTRFARGEQWLRFATRQQAFKAALGDNIEAESTESSGLLADWFAEHYVIEDEYFEAALSVINAVGYGRLGPILWDAIGRQLHIHDVSPSSTTARLLILMCRDDPRTQGPWLDYQFNRCAWPEDAATYSLLLEHLTRSSSQLRRGFFDGYSAEIALRGDSHWLREAWAKVHPITVASAQRLLHPLQGNLRYAFLNIEVANPGRATAAYLGRVAIEQHEQEWHTDDLDFLIDSVRDCLEALIDGRHPAGARLVEEWVDDDIAIFRRLGLHGLRRSPDLSAAEKFQRLVVTNSFLDYRVKHEAFLLAAETVGLVSEEEVQSLVDQVLTHEVGVDHPYEIFNSLVWLQRYKPGSVCIESALAEVRGMQPGWEEREHPDLVISGGAMHWGQNDASIDTGEFHELIADGVNVAIESVRERASGGDDLERDMRGGVYQVVAETVREYPLDGLVLMPAFRNDTYGMRSVVEGWIDARVDRSIASLIADGLLRAELSGSVGAVARLLNQSVESSAPSWRSIPAARELAEVLWPLIHEDEEGGVSGGDVMTESLNHPAGRLANYWTLCASEDWRRSGDSWGGLTPELSANLDAMVRATGRKGTMAKVMLFRYLHFYAACDRGWCQKVLMPLLQWSENLAAGSCWSAFTRWGRWSPTLLELNLMELYLDALAHVEEVDADVRSGLARHLGAVAVFGEGAHSAEHWVDRFVAVATPEIRREWIRDVERYLAELPAEDVEAKWATWIREYWRRRLESVPCALSAAEASGMALLIQHLPASFEEGVEFVLATDAGMSEHSMFLSDIPVDGLRQKPEIWAAVITHLLMNTKGSFWGLHALSSVLQHLRSAGLGQAELSGLLEAAARLGYYEE